MLCASVAVIPGVPVGDAATIDEAKARFEAAWVAFKDQQGPEKLAEAYATMEHTDRGRSSERAQADQLLKNFEALHQLLDRFCHQMRHKVNSSTL